MGCFLSGILPGRIQRLVAETPRCLEVSFCFVGRPRAGPAAWVWLPSTQQGHSSFYPVAEGRLHFLIQDGCTRSSLHIFSNREEGMSSLFGSCISFLITFHWSEPSHMDFPTCKRQWEIEPLFCFVTWTLTSVPHPQSQPPTLASSLVAGNRNQSG